MIFIVIGGALATFAAVDLKMHTLPRINAWLRIQRMRHKLGLYNKPILHVSNNNNNNIIESNIDNITTTTTTNNNQHNSDKVVSDSDKVVNNRDSLKELAISRTQSLKIENLYEINKVRIAMYNYGSPKVGNGVFVNHFNKHIPNGFRVCVDGDIVTGLPKGSYRHVGTNIMVDSLGAGSIIIDPSYIENRLRSRTKAHVSVHSLIIYRQGLQGVRTAAENMRNLAQRNVNNSKSDLFDSVRIAISAGPLKAWVN